MAADPGGRNQLVCGQAAAAIAIAVAIAAAGVAAIGTRLAYERAGLAAGLMFAIFLVTNRHGQEARSYALPSHLTGSWSVLVVAIPLAIVAVARCPRSPVVRLGLAWRLLPPTILLMVNAVTQAYSSDIFCSAFRVSRCWPPSDLIWSRRRSPPGFGQGCPGTGSAGRDGAAGVGRGRRLHRDSGAGRLSRSGRTW